MNLDQEILKVLVEAGAKGLKIEKIARHVYNSCNSIFNPLSYENVHAYVTQFLIKCSKNPKSIIEKGKGVGIYHVNYKNEAIMQLMIDFSSSNMQQQDIDEGKANLSQNCTPDLFDNDSTEKLFNSSSVPIDE